MDFDGVEADTVFALEFASKECLASAASSLSFNFSSQWQAILPSAVQLYVLSAAQQDNLTVTRVQLQQHASLAYDTSTGLAHYAIRLDVELTLGGFLAGVEAASSAPHTLHAGLQGSFSPGLVPVASWQGELHPPADASADAAVLRDMDSFDGKPPAVVTGLAKADGAFAPIANIVNTVLSILDSPHIRLGPFQSAPSSLDASLRAVLPQRAVASAGTALLSNASRTVGRLILPDGTILTGGLLLQFSHAAGASELLRLLPEAARVATSDASVAELCPNPTLPAAAASARASVDVYFGEDVILVRGWAASALAQLECTGEDVFDSGVLRSGTSPSSGSATTRNGHVSSDISNATAGAAFDDASGSSSSVALQGTASLAAGFHASSPGFDEPWYMSDVLKDPLQLLQLVQALDPRLKGELHGTFDLPGGLSATLLAGDLFGDTHSGRLFTYDMPLDAATATSHLLPLFGAIQKVLTTGVAAVDKHLKDVVFPTSTEGLTALTQDCIAAHPTPTLLRCLSHHFTTATGQNRLFFDPRTGHVVMDLTIVLSAFPATVPPDQSGALKQINAALTTLSQHIASGPLSVKADDFRLNTTLDVALHAELVVSELFGASAQSANLRAVSPTVTPTSEPHFTAKQQLSVAKLDPLQNVMFTLLNVASRNATSAQGVSIEAELDTQQTPDRFVPILLSPTGQFTGPDVLRPLPPGATTWDSALESLRGAIDNITSTSLQPLELDLGLLGFNSWLAIADAVSELLAKASTTSFRLGDVAVDLSSALRAAIADDTANPTAHVDVSMHGYDTQSSIFVNLTIVVTSHQRLDTALQASGTAWQTTVDTSRLVVSPVVGGELSFTLQYDSKLSRTAATLAAFSFRLDGEASSKGRRLPFQIGMLPAVEMVSHAQLQLSLLAPSLNAADIVINASFTLDLDVELGSFGEHVQAHLGLTNLGTGNTDTEWDLPMPQVATAVSSVVGGLETHVLQLTARLLEGGLNIVIPGLASGLKEVAPVVKDAADFVFKGLQHLANSRPQLTAVSAQLADIAKVEELQLNFSTTANQYGMATNMANCLIDNKGTLCDYSSPANWVKSFNDRLNETGCGLGRLIKAELESPASGTTGSFTLVLYPRVRGGLSSLTLQAFSAQTLLPKALPIRVDYKAASGKQPLARTWKDMAYLLQLVFAIPDFKLPQIENITVADHPELVPDELRPYWPATLPGIRQGMHFDFGKGTRAVQSATHWSDVGGMVSVDLRDAQASASVQANFDVDMIFAMNVPPAGNNITLFSQLPQNETVESATVPEQNNTVTIALQGVLRHRTDNNTSVAPVPVFRLFHLTLTPNAIFATDMCQKLDMALPVDLKQVLTCDTGTRQHGSWRDLKRVKLSTPPTLRHARRAALEDLRSKKQEVRLMTQRVVMSNGSLFVPQGLGIAERTLPYFNLSSNFPSRSVLMLDKLQLQASVAATVSVKTANVVLSVLEASAARVLAGVSCNFSIGLQRPLALARDVSQAAMVPEKIADALQVQLGVHGRFQAGNLSLAIGPSGNLLTPDAHLLLTAGGTYVITPDFAIADLTAALGRWNLTFVGTAQLEALLRQLSSIPLGAPCQTISAIFDAVDATRKDSSASTNLPIINKALGPVLDSHLGQAIEDVTKAICSQNGVSLTTLCQAISAALGVPDFCLPAVLTPTNLTISFRAMTEPTAESVAMLFDSRTLLGSHGFLPLGESITASLALNVNASLGAELVIDFTTSPPSLSFTKGSATLGVQAELDVMGQADLFFGSVRIPFAELSFNIGHPATLSVSIGFGGRAAQLAAAATFCHASHGHTKQGRYLDPAATRANTACAASTASTELVASDTTAATGGAGEFHIVITGSAHLRAELQVESQTCDMRIDVPSISDFVRRQPGSFSLSSQACPGGALAAALTKALEEAALVYMLLDSGRLEQQIAQSWLEFVSWTIEKFTGVDLPLARNKWVDAISVYLVKWFFGNAFFKNVFGAILNELLKLAKSPSQLSTQIEQAALNLFTSAVCKEIESALPPGYCATMRVPIAGQYPYVFHFPLAFELTHTTDSVGLHLGKHGEGTLKGCQLPLTIGTSATVDLVYNQHNWTFSFPNVAPQPSLEAHVLLELSTCTMSGSLGPIGAEISAEGGVEAHISLSRTADERWPTQLDAGVNASMNGLIDVGFAGVLARLFNESNEEAMVNLPHVQAGVSVTFACDNKGGCSLPVFGYSNVSLCLGHFLGPVIGKLTAFTKNKWFNDVTRFVDHLTEENPTLKYLLGVDTFLALIQLELKSHGKEELAKDLGYFVAVVDDIEGITAILDQLAGSLQDGDCTTFHQLVQAFELDYNKPTLVAEPKGEVPSSEPIISSQAYPNEVTRQSLTSVYHSIDQIGGLGFSVPCMGQWLTCIGALFSQTNFQVVELRLPGIRLVYQVTHYIPVFMAVVAEFDATAEVTIGETILAIGSKASLTAVATGSVGAILAAVEIDTEDPQTHAQLVPVQFGFSLGGSIGIYLGIINAAFFARVGLTIAFYFYDFRHQGYTTLADFFYLIRLNGNPISAMVLVLDVYGEYGFWVSICTWIGCLKIIELDYTVPLYNRRWTPKSQIPSAVGTNINLHALSQIGEAYTATPYNSGAAVIKLSQDQSDDGLARGFGGGQPGARSPVDVHLYTIDVDPIGLPPQSSAIPAGGSTISSVGSIPSGMSVIFDVYGVARAVAVPSSQGTIVQLHGDSYVNMAAITISPTAVIPSGTAGILFNGRCSLLNVTSPPGVSGAGAYLLSGSPCPQALRVNPTIAVTLTGLVADYAPHTIALDAQSQGGAKNVTVTVDAVYFVLTLAGLGVTQSSHAAFGIDFAGGSPAALQVRSHPYKDTQFDINAVSAETCLLAGGGKGNNTFFLQLAAIKGGAFLVGNHVGRSRVSLAVDCYAMDTNNASVTVSGSAVTVLTGNATAAPYRVTLAQIQDVDVNVTSTAAGHVHTNVMNVPEFSLFTVRAENTANASMTHVFGGCSESGTAFYRLSKGNHELTIGADGHLHSNYKCAVFVQGEDVAGQNYTVIINAAAEAADLQWEVQADTVMVQSRDPSAYWLLAVTLDNIDHVVLHLGSTGNDLTMHTTLQQAELAVFFPNRPLDPSGVHRQTLAVQQVLKSAMVFGAFEAQLGKMTQKRDQDPCATWLGSLILVQGSNSSYTVTMESAAGETAPRQCYLFTDGCVGVSHCGNGSAKAPVYAPTAWLTNVAATAGLVGAVKRCSVAWTGSQSAWTLASGGAGDVINVTDFKVAMLDIETGGGDDTVTLDLIAGNVTVDLGDGNDNLEARPLADSTSLHLTMLLGHGSDTLGLWAPCGDGVIADGDDHNPDTITIFMNQSWPSLTDLTIGPLGWDRSDSEKVGGAIRLDQWRRQDLLQFRVGPATTSQEGAQSKVVSAPSLRTPIGSPGDQGGYGLATLQMPVAGGILQRELVSDATFKIESLAEGAIVVLDANGDMPAVNYTVELTAPSYVNSSVVRLLGNPSGGNGTLVLVGPLQQEGIMSLSEASVSDSSGRLVLAGLLVQLDVIEHIAIVSPPSLGLHGAQAPAIAVTVDTVPSNAELVVDTGGENTNGTVNIVTMNSPLMIAGQGCTLTLAPDNFARIRNVYVAAAARIIVPAGWAQNASLASGCLSAPGHEPGMTSAWFQNRAALRSPLGQAQAALSATCSLVLAGAGPAHLEIAKLNASNLGATSVANLSLVTDQLFLDDDASWSSNVTLTANGLRVQDRFNVVIRPTPSATDVPRVQSLAASTFTVNASLHVACLGDASAPVWLFGADAELSSPAGRLIWSTADFRQASKRRVGCSGAMGLAQDAVPAFDAQPAASASQHRLYLAVRPVARHPSSARHMIAVWDGGADFSEPGAGVPSTRFNWGAMGIPALFELALDDANETVLDSSQVERLTPQVTVGPDAVVHILLPKKGRAAVAANVIQWHPSTRSFQPETIAGKLACVAPEDDCTKRAMMQLLFQKDTACAAGSRQEKECGHRSGIRLSLAGETDVYCLPEPPTDSGFTPLAGAASYMGVRVPTKETALGANPKQVANFLTFLVVAASFIAAASLAWLGWAVDFPIMTIFFSSVLLFASDEDGSYAGLSNFEYSASNLMTEAYLKLGVKHASCSVEASSSGAAGTGQAAAFIFLGLLTLVLAGLNVYHNKTNPTRKQACEKCLVCFAAFLGFLLLPGAAALSSVGWSAVTAIVLLVLVAVFLYRPFAQGWFGAGAGGEHKALLLSAGDAGDPESAMMTFTPEMLAYTGQSPHGSDAEDDEDEADNGDPVASRAAAEEVDTDSRDAAEGGDNTPDSTAQDSMPDRSASPNANDSEQGAAAVPMLLAASPLLIMTLVSLVGRSDNRSANAVIQGFAMILYTGTWWLRLWKYSEWPQWLRLAIVTAVSFQLLFGLILLGAASQGTSMSNQGATAVGCLYYIAACSASVIVAVRLLYTLYNSTRQSGYSAL